MGLKVMRCGSDARFSLEEKYEALESVDHRWSIIIG